MIKNPARDGKTEDTQCCLEGVIRSGREMGMNLRTQMILRAEARLSLSPRGTSGERAGERGSFPEELPKSRVEEKAPPLPCPLLRYAEAREKPIVPTLRITLLAKRRAVCVPQFHTSLNRTKRAVAPFSTGTVSQATT
jgi:hypothetical protein